MADRNDDNLNAAKLEAILHLLLGATSDEDLERRKAAAREVAGLSEADLAGDPEEDEPARHAREGTFLRYLRGEGEERLWVYECPRCGGDAYNGDPEAGTRFRGSARCSECGESFSAVKSTPKSKDGPVLRHRREGGADGGHGPRAWAAFLADLWNAVRAAGGDPDTDAPELEGSGWSVVEKGGRFEPAPEGEEEPEQYRRVAAGTPGAVWKPSAKGGRLAGWWIDADQARREGISGTAPPEGHGQKRKTAAQKKEELSARKVDRAALKDKLSAHAQALDDKTKKSAAAGFRTMARYHGENAAARIEQLAEEALAALEKAPAGKKADLEKQLARLAHMETLLGPAKGDGGKKDGEVRDVSEGGGHAGGTGGGGVGGSQLAPARGDVAVGGGVPDRGGADDPAAAGRGGVAEGSGGPPAPGGHGGEPGGPAVAGGGRGDELLARGASARGGREPGGEDQGGRELWQLTAADYASKQIEEARLDPEKAKSDAVLAELFRKGKNPHDDDRGVRVVTARQLQQAIDRHERATNRLADPVKHDGVDYAVSRVGDGMFMVMKADHDLSPTREYRDRVGAAVRRAVEAGTDVPPQVLADVRFTGVDASGAKWDGGVKSDTPPEAPDGRDDPGDGAPVGQPDAQGVAGPGQGGEAGAEADAPAEGGGAAGEGAYGLPKPLADHSDLELQQELARRWQDLSDDDLKVMGFKRGAFRISPQGVLQQYLGKHRGREDWRSFDWTDTSGHLGAILKATGMPSQEEIILRNADLTPDEPEEDNGFDETLAERLAGVDDPGQESAVRAEHRDEVEHALRQGFPVAPRVLADYPDLAAKAQKEGASNLTPPADAPAEGGGAAEEEEGAEKVTAPEAGFKVGQTLTYTGRAGAMPAEFRGFHSDPATGEKVARVIVRPDSGPPFEASVKPSELSDDTPAEADVRVPAVQKGDARLLDAPAPQQEVPVLPQGQAKAQGVREPWKMTAAQFEAADIGAGGADASDALEYRNIIKKRLADKGIRRPGDDLIRAEAMRYETPDGRTYWDVIQAGERAPRTHRAAVEAALAAGKPVPPEVLADYPDLAAKAGGASNLTPPLESPAEAPSREPPPPSRVGGDPETTASLRDAVGAAGGWHRGVAGAIPKAPTAAALEKTLLDRANRAGGGGFLSLLHDHGIYSDGRVALVPTAKDLTHFEKSKFAAHKGVSPERGAGMAKMVRDTMAKTPTSSASMLGEPAAAQTQNGTTWLLFRPPAGRPVVLNAEFYALVRSRYPDAVLYAGRTPTDAVLVTSGGEKVGIIMPASVNAPDDVKIADAPGGVDAFLANFEEVTPADQIEVGKETTTNGYKSFEVAGPYQPEGRRPSLTVTQSVKGSPIYDVVASGYGGARGTQRLTEALATGLSKREARDLAVKILRHATGQDGPHLTFRPRGATSPEAKPAPEAPRPAASPPPPAPAPAPAPASAPRPEQPPAPRSATSESHPLAGRQVFTTGDVAKILQVAPRTVSKWFDANKLKGYRIPGTQDRRIPRFKLVSFMRDNGMAVPDWLAADPDESEQFSRYERLARLAHARGDRHSAAIYMRQARGEF